MLSRIFSVPIDIDVEVLAVVEGSTKGSGQMVDGIDAVHGLASHH